ncbi:hypothetical protein DS909_02975 [Phaeobacter gallaeciensis]|uniref:Uncharacterized protein n=2 Tax=Roseobacteraceae TaxID=2854170 RepID=A0A366XA71_9RHOB|nr:MULTISPECIES: hypothetical protein [Roseobacteraceae]MBT3143169.1 hypothetical protein [Falsiruegeria litorea]MBT8167658.1 hypothetical protein [Falsiruegeria litorea]RBW60928.1 hypothetical protein DS909_02975 [Phaeobacter gallaeciensis]
MTLPRYVASSIGIALLILPQVAAATGKVDSKDQKIEKGAQVPDTDPRWSNWPHLPDGQAGRSYRKLVRPEYGGPVERNFESGRR